MQIPDAILDLQVLDRLRNCLIKALLPSDSGLRVHEVHVLLRGRIIEGFNGFYQIIVDFHLDGRFVLSGLSLFTLDKAERGAPRELVHLHISVGKTLRDESSLTHDLKTVG